LGDTYGLEGKSSGAPPAQEVLVVKLRVVEEVEGVVRKYSGGARKMKL
jgi:hypothetical protein